METCRIVQPSVGHDEKKRLLTPRGRLSRLQCVALHSSALLGVYLAVNGEFLGIRNETFAVRAEIFRSRSQMLAIWSEVRTVLTEILRVKTEIPGVRILSPSFRDDSLTVKLISQRATPISPPVG
jgi:hypothetical protein